MKLDSTMIRAALIASFAKLNPVAPDPQPGDVRGRGRRRDHHHRLADPGVRRRAARRRRRAGLVHVHGRDLALADGRVRQPRRGARRGPRQGAGRCPAGDAHGHHRPPARRARGAGLGAAARRRGRRRGRGGHSRRRDRDRGHRLGGRVGDHRRIGAGDPGVRRRPQRGHRRHPRALGPDRGRDHPGARQELPGSDDRPGRGCRAAQDPERDRAQHPARGADPGLPAGRRLAAPVRALRQHRGLRRDPDRAAGGVDPDHDRRAAVRDRDRRHGPTRAPQRARALRPCGRGLRRHRRAAARQDRHDHARKPRGDRVHPDARRQRGGSRRGGPDRLARRRNARGPFDRRAGEAVRDPRARVRPRSGDLRPVLGRDPDERRRPRRQPAAQGRRRRDSRLRRGAGRPGPGRAAGSGRPDRPRGGHTAGGGPRRAGARRHLSQGRGQGGDAACGSTTCGRWASAR